MKSIVEERVIGGEPVIVKKIAPPGHAVWKWYFEREVEMYREFKANPPPFPVPRLVAASDRELVISRIAGGALATKRSPYAVLSRSTVEKLIALRATVATYDGPPEIEAPHTLRSQMRDRLLEDPTAPKDWITDGLRRCEKRGFIENSEDLVEAIEAHSPIAFSHGDMLLKNVVGDALVDWECAGTHLYDWDLALLYTQLDPISRQPILDAVGSEGPRAEAFRALVIFAFARELRFLAAFPNPPERASQRLRDEIADLG